MEFNCKVNIVDAIMGAGKTQSIMNYINQSDEDEKFLVITPFLDEIDRYRKYCSCKNFKAPTFLKDDKDEKGSKLNDLKRLIGKWKYFILNRFNIHSTYIFKKICTIFQSFLLSDIVVNHIFIRHFNSFIHTLPPKKYYFI